MTAPASQISKLPRSASSHSPSSRKSNPSADAGVSFDDTLAQARSKPNSAETQTSSQSTRLEEQDSQPVRDKPHPDRPESSTATPADGSSVIANQTDKTPQNKPSPEASVDQKSSQKSTDEPILESTAPLADPETNPDGESPNRSAKPGSIPLAEAKSHKSSDVPSADEPSKDLPPTEILPKNEKPPVTSPVKTTQNQLAPESESSDAPNTDASLLKPTRTTEPNLPRHLQTKEKDNSSEEDSPKQSKNTPFNSVNPSTLVSLTPEDSSLATAFAQSLPEQPQSSPAKADSPALHPTPAPLPQESNPRAETTTPAQETPKNSHENPFEQIMLGLRGKFDPKNGRAEIRLDPPSLGTVHVSINLQNGLLTAQLQSDSAPVQELLKSNLDQLKNVLESQGVTVDKLVVNNTQDKSALTMTNSSLQTNADGRGSNSQSSDQRRPQPQPEDEFTRIWNELTAAKKPLDLVA